MTLWLCLLVLQLLRQHRVHLHVSQFVHLNRDIRLMVNLGLTLDYFIAHFHHSKPSCGLTRRYFPVRLRYLKLRHFSFSYVMDIQQTSIYFVSLGRVKMLISDIVNILCLTN